MHLDIWHEGYVNEHNLLVQVAACHARETTLHSKQRADLIVGISIRCASWSGYHAAVYHCRHRLYVVTAIDMPIESFAVLHNQGCIMQICTKTWKQPADVIVGISVAVLLVIFCLQRLGSSRIGFLYSPILITWFLVNATIGVYNIVKWQPDVFKAVSPSYAVRYFQSGSRGAWLSLGGCVLCITGSEAMFADMGHFSHKSILVRFLLIRFQGQYTCRDMHQCLHQGALMYVRMKSGRSVCVHGVHALDMPVTVNIFADECPLLHSFLLTLACLSFCLSHPSIPACNKGMTRPAALCRHQWNQMLMSRSASHQNLWLQIVALGLVYPSVLLIYFGEAAYLMHNTQDFAQSYFKVSRGRDAKVGTNLVAIRIRQP